MVRTLLWEQAWGRNGPRIVRPYEAAQNDALIKEAEHRMDPKSASPLLGPMLEGMAGL
jgi:hypothetical protein